MRQATADRDVTPFMLRLALVKAWLARLTGADDVLIGSPVAGRDRSETEALVGFFVNLLPLRTSLDGRPVVRRKSWSASSGAASTRTRTRTTRSTSSCAG